MISPSAEVIRAFGGSPDAIQSLAGGEGRSWRAGTVVLKPAGDEVALAWLGEVLARVGEAEPFRLARPLRTQAGTWVVDGWQATTWLDGSHQSGRTDDILAVSAPLHAALLELDIELPDVIREDTSPWAAGARAAWGDDDSAEVERPPSVTEALTRLAPLLAQEWTGSGPQLIHGDLGGNVLFADDDGLRPAVLDFSPAFRPAPFADAIVVADAIAWGAEPAVTAIRFAASRPQGDQLLARAIAFRLVAAVHLWEGHPARVDAEVQGYGRLLPLLIT